MVDLELIKPTTPQQYGEDKDINRAKKGDTKMKIEITNWKRATAA